MPVQVHSPIADADGDDAAIVRRVLAGEREAYATLVFRYQWPLRAALQAVCKSPDQAEEMTQAGFVKAYVNLAGFDQRAPFLPWLKVIAINELRKENRRRDVAVRHAGQYLDHLHRLEGETQVDAQRERLDALRHCLGTLHPNHHDLLRSFYQEQCTLADEALRRSTTVGALKVRLLRLRTLLRDCIAARLGQAGA